MLNKSGAVGKIEYRYATAVDARNFWGKPMHETFRGMAWTLDGEVVGLMGICRDAAGSKFFADYLPEMESRMNEISMQRVLMITLGWVKKHPYPVHAVAKHEKGHALLQRIGFTHLDKDVYLWPK